MMRRAGISFDALACAARLCMRTRVSCVPRGTGHRRCAGVHVVRLCLVTNRPTGVARLRRRPRVLEAGTPGRRSGSRACLRRERSGVGSRRRKVRRRGQRKGGRPAAAAAQPPRRRAPRTAAARPATAHGARAARAAPAARPPKHPRSLACHCRIAVSGASDARPPSQAAQRQAAGAMDGGEDALKGARKMQGAYSSSSLLQNTAAYSRDGRVRAPWRSPPGLWVAHERARGAIGRAWAVERASRRNPVACGWRAFWAWPLCGPKRAPGAAPT